MSPEYTQIMEIFVAPGEFYFGDRDTRIRTLLGSCVAITMWHPARRIGGMCHYMLPTRGKASADAPAGRYADEAIELFLGEIAAAGTLPSQYEVKLFGGGDQFPGIEHCIAETVPQRNVGTGRSLVNRHGFRIKMEDLGGSGHRNLIFDIWNGNVWMRKPQGPLHRGNAQRPSDREDRRSDGGRFGGGAAGQLLAHQQ